MWPVCPFKGTVEWDGFFPFHPLNGDVLGFLDFRIDLNWVRSTQRPRPITWYARSIYLIRRLRQEHWPFLWIFKIKYIFGSNYKIKNIEIIARGSRTEGMLTNHLMPLSLLRNEQKIKDVKCQISFEIWALLNGDYLLPGETGWPYAWGPHWTKGGVFIFKFAKKAEKDSKTPEQSTHTIWLFDKKNLVKI